MSRCSTDEMDYCFKAFPQASPMKDDDPDKQCRTVLVHNRDMDYDWVYSDDLQSQNKGLCALSDDPDRQCSRSWDPLDPLLNEGNTNMVRVRKTPI